MTDKPKTALEVAVEALEAIAEGLSRETRWWEFSRVARGALSQIAALRSVEEKGGWKPIETAPKDDTQFLATTSDGRMMIWAGRLLRSLRGTHTPFHLQFPATHWMPLPAPPDALYTDQSSDRTDTTQTLEGMAYCGPAAGAQPTREEG